MREKEEREREGQKENGRKKGFVHRMDMISTSFFFTNFPEEVGWGDLWKLFAKYGSVCDVFILKKVDKWGRKFGFVKFKEVKEVEALSKKLEDVWWEKYKLRINRARFRKGEKPEVATVEQQQPSRTLAVNEVLVNDDQTFKLILQGKTGVEGVQVDKDGMVVNADGGRRKNRCLSLGDLVPLELVVQESTVRALNQSLVGFFKETMDFQSFSDRLVMEGHHEVKAVYMGGNMVLLQCVCDGELEEVKKLNQKWWDHCFTKLIPWKPNLLSECRDIWIQVYGLPIHAWEENSFKRIAGRFGVFLDFDEATVAKLWLDVARIKLRTVRRGMIDTVLQLKVLGDLFDVWVVEERCSCSEEDCYEVEEGDRSGENGGSGEEVWRGEDNDLFSDGRSDSDGSESCQVLSKIHKEGNKHASMLAVENEGLGKVDLQGQNFVEVSVGERETDGPIYGGQVEGGGEELSQIPSCDEVGERCVVRGTVVGQDDISNIVQKVVTECVGEEVERGDEAEVGPVIGEVGSGNGLIGPNTTLWNPFLDCEDLEVADPSPILVQVCESDRQWVFCGDVEAEGIGANSVVRLSQISESSTEPPQQVEARNCIRNAKKSGIPKCKHPPPPLLGIPKFCQLEMAVKASGKRRKEAGSMKQGNDVSADTNSSSNGNDENPGIDLQVVLPTPSSGVNLLVDQDGGSVHVSVSNSGDVASSKEEDVRALMAIQKRVGFSFEANEDEIQSKLIELENVDEVKVQERVDQ
jgi:hypothetical protein